MNEDTYANSVGQMVNTTGDSPVLVLGSQLPGFPRPFSSLFSKDGETAICRLIDGASYQVVSVRWNANTGTLTRQIIHEGWQEGSSFSEMPLELSGAARIIAGHSRQALDHHLASARLNAGLASLKMPLVTDISNILLPNHSYILAPEAEADLPSAPADGSIIILAGDIGVDENKATIKAQDGDTIAGETIFSVQTVRRVFRLVYRSQNSDWGIFT